MSVAEDLSRMSALAHAPTGLFCATVTSPLLSSHSLEISRLAGGARRMVLLLDAVDGHVGTCARLWEDALKSFQDTLTSSLERTLHRHDLASTPEAELLVLLTTGGVRCARNIPDPHSQVGA
jgi:hypothetical protein